MSSRVEGGVVGECQQELSHVKNGSAAWSAALQAAGTRVSINTAFVERLNPSLRSVQVLILRQAVAALTRRTLCLAKAKHHLQLRLNAYRVYYNLVRVHLTLKTAPAVLERHLGLLAPIFSLWNIAAAKWRIAMIGIVCLSVGKGY